MDGSRVKAWVYRPLAALLIAACLLACCAVPAHAVVAETVLVGGTLVVATVLVALGFFALSDTRLGDMAQRIVDAAATAGVPWLTADREIAVLEFGIGMARRVARQVVNWIKGWVSDPVNSALVGTWRADIVEGAVYPLTDSEYIDPEEFILTEVLSNEYFATLWNDYSGSYVSDWNEAKAGARFIVLAIKHGKHFGEPYTTYIIEVFGSGVEYQSVKVIGTSSDITSLGAFVTPEGVGTQVYPNTSIVMGTWYDDGRLLEYRPGTLPGHNPSDGVGIIAMNYGGPGVVFDGADLTAGTIGTVYPDWDALGDADTLPLAVPDSLSSLVGVTAEQAQTVQGSEEPEEPEPSPSAPPAPLPDEVGGLWQYVRALIDDMAAALSQVGAFITALPPAIVVPVWAAVALLVIIGLIRAFVGG